MLPRALYYFPIVHSHADLGSLGESVRRASLKKIGERAWRRKAALVERLWRGIGEAIDALSLRYEQTRVYQDGLPVCESQEVGQRILQEAVDMGSPNYLLLARLQERGAIIMGTESAELLLEEYALAKRALGAGDAALPPLAAAEQNATGALLLTKRDVFIAERIDRTLQVGETGVLFLGSMHDVARRLPAGIEVRYPINRPSYTTS